MNAASRTLLIALLAFPALRAELRIAGSVAEVQAIEGGVEMKLDSGALARVEILKPGLIRFRLSRTGKLQTRRSGAVVLSDPPEPGTLVSDSPDEVTLRSSAAVITIRKSGFRATVRRRDGSLVVADEESGTGWNEETGGIFCRKLAPPEEAYFGLGARGGPINRRGRTIVMHNVDQNAYGEFTDPLYISIPFFYGVKDGRAWGLFFDNTADPFFDMDSFRDGRLTIGAAKGELDYYVFTGPEPWTVASSYAALTGPTALPPLWSIGYHQSRYGYKSQEEFLSLAKRLREERFPCDVLWFDIDYMDRLQNFTWNSKSFPDPVGMNRSLHTMGFRRVNIVEPLFTIDDTNWPYLDGAGLLLRNPDGTSNVSEIWYGSVSFLDFTKADARSWYKLALAGFVDRYSIDGLWQDLNEPAQNFFPYVMYNNDGDPVSDLEGRNTYALNMARTSWEAMQEIRPNVRPWAISRSGYAGIQRYSANWSGDALTSFDSLRVSLQMTISMGVSGQNFFGHDIGGFLGSPSPELFYRWMQFGSMIPLFRTHASNDTAPREPWSFGPGTAGRVREIINLRYQLLPYLYTAFKDSSDNGLPIVAPLWFYYPADNATYGEDSSFLLGRDLLVAPIVAQGTTRRMVYLPAGDDWVRFDGGEVLKGGQSVLAIAEDATIPLFVRAGAVIVMGPVRQNVKDPGDASLTVHVYPGASEGSAEIYEDDGESHDHRNGAFSRTRFEQYQISGSRVLVENRIAKGYTLPPRGLWIRFHGFENKPSQVLANGIGLVQAGGEATLQSGLYGWWYNSENKTLVVKAPDLEYLQVIAQP